MNQSMPGSATWVDVKSGTSKKLFRAKNIEMSPMSNKRPKVKLWKFRIKRLAFGFAISTMNLQLILILWKVRFKLCVVCILSKEWLWILRVWVLVQVLVDVSAARCMLRLWLERLSLESMSKRVAISNSTGTNSKTSETRHFLNSTYFNLDKHKLEI